MFTQGELYIMIGWYLTSSNPFLAHHMHLKVSARESQLTEYKDFYGNPV